MKKKESKNKVIMVKTKDLSKLTHDQLLTLCSDVMKKLDDLSMDDFFGTEGWRQYLGYGD